MLMLACAASDTQAKHLHILQNLSYCGAQALRLSIGADGGAKPKCRYQAIRLRHPPHMNPSTDSFFKTAASRLSFLSHSWLKVHLKCLIMCSRQFGWVHVCMTMYLIMAYCQL